MMGDRALVTGVAGFILPLKETSLPQPRSPYGVTKLAAEHLCFLYYDNFGVSTVSLRYFTVYGPGQRPDMAFHKFIKAMLEDRGSPVRHSGRGGRESLQYWWR